MTTRPPIPDPPYTGGCLCGAVRYELNTRPLSITACHCADCQRLSGGTNLLLLLAERAGFSADGETHIFRKTSDSGRQSDIVRCAECGTRLWQEPLGGPDFLLVAAGTFDDSSWVIPTIHIWTQNAMPWPSFDEDALKVEGQPTGRPMTIEAFNKIYGTPPGE